MRHMSGRRRFRASWLLVLFTSMSLGVCVAALSGVGGKLPCCKDVADGRVSLSACCGAGQQSSSLDLPVGLQAPLPPVSAIAFEVAPQTLRDAAPRRHSSANVPYRSADPQAFFSTFLI